MKKNIQKVESILNELYQINEWLGGSSLRSDYTSENVEFDQLMKLFRQQIFEVRQNQKERDYKETKFADKSNPELLKLNHLIREGIRKCSEMLLLAEKRGVTANSKFKSLSSPEKEKILKQLDNCANLLQDVKEVEQGGTYQPPTVVNLKTLKKNLMEDRESGDYGNEEINVDEHEALEQMNKRDRKMDDILDQIIQGDKRFKGKLKDMGQMIKLTDEKIQKATKKVESTTLKINQTNDMLVEVLQKYRRPNKLCLDITFVVMLLGLVGVIINMFKSNALG